MAGPIPASAGEPAMPQAAKDELRAYPRQRGGTRGSDPHRRLGMGLSPPARGNQNCSDQQHTRRGPIPASAGEPAWASVVRCSSRAYPRQRGGTSNDRSLKIPAEGLSPPARGNRDLSPRSGVGAGPIPASAGEPASCRRRERPWWAYPRQRGGTMLSTIATSVCGGLSPPARGNRG